MNMSKRMISRIISIMMCLMMTAGMVAFNQGTVFAASSVKVGQATSDENGKTKGGTAGDQKGGEVGTTAWTYSSTSTAYNHWRYIFRAKDDAVAKKLAIAMKAACSNNHVGYDQTIPDRYSLYDEAEKVGWDISKITNDCETTCASVVSVCLNAAGIDAPRYMDSSVIRKYLKNRSDFEMITSTSYTASDKYLEAGDILVSGHWATNSSGNNQWYGRHTCMVVSSPNTAGSSSWTATTTVATGATATSTTASFTKGKNYKLLTDLNVRKGAGTTYAIVSYNSLTDDAKAHSVSTTTAVLKKGTIVTALKVSGNWIKIPSGWICGQAGTNLYIKEYTPKTVKLTVGTEYKLKKALYVRKGPGTSHTIKKYSQLTSGAKKYATKSSKARLKKGTVVTCIKKSGNWIKIPSGWICAKSGNLAYA